MQYYFLFREGQTFLSSIPNGECLPFLFQIIISFFFFYKNSQSSLIIKMLATSTIYLPIFWFS